MQTLEQQGHIGRGTFRMAGLLGHSFQGFLHLEMKSKTLKSYGSDSQQSMVNYVLSTLLSGTDSCTSTGSAAPRLIVLTELLHVVMGPLV